MPFSSWLASAVEHSLAARERFLARVRPEAMDEPVPSQCPDGVPAEWTRAAEEVEGSDGGE